MTQQLHLAYQFRQIEIIARPSQDLSAKTGNIDTYNTLNSLPLVNQQNQPIDQLVNSGFGNDSEFQANLIKLITNFYNTSVNKMEELINSTRLDDLLYNSNNNKYQINDDLKNYIQAHTKFNDPINNYGRDDTHAIIASLDKLNDLAKQLFWHEAQTLTEKSRILDVLPMRKVVVPDGYTNMLSNLQVNDVTGIENLVLANRLADAWANPSVTTSSTIVSIPDTRQLEYYRDMATFGFWDKPAPIIVNTPPDFNYIEALHTLSHAKPDPEIEQPEIQVVIWSEDTLSNFESEVD